MYTYALYFYLMFDRLLVMLENLKPQFCDQTFNPLFNLAIHISNINKHLDILQAPDILQVPDIQQVPWLPRVTLLIKDNHTRIHK